MSSDDEGFVWCWYQEEIRDSDEDEQESDDDLIVFPRKCPKCGSKLFWSKDKGKWVCPACNLSK